MNKLYESWLESSATLKTIKAEELKLRNKIIDGIITDQVKGIFHFKKGHYQINIGMGISQSLDESVLDTIYDDMTDLEKNCVKYKASLVAKEMKELDGSESLFEAITEKPRQPTLKIEVIE